MDSTYHTNKRPWSANHAEETIKSSKTRILGYNLPGGQKFLGLQVVSTAAFGLAHIKSSKTRALCYNLPCYETIYRVMLRVTIYHAMKQSWPS